VNPLEKQIDDLKETVIRFHKEDREDRKAFRLEIAKEHQDIWKKIAEVERVAYTSIPPLTHYIQMALVFLTTSGIGAAISLWMKLKGV
jgi:hypothetical protein